MITDEDVKKLSKVFATKDDIKNLNSRISDLNEKLDEIHLNLAELLGKLVKDVREIKVELRGNRAIISDFEGRISYLEEKIGSKNNLGEFRDKVKKYGIRLKLK